MLSAGSAAAVEERFGIRVTLLGVKETGRRPLQRAAHSNPLW
jgi:hypothetical protein